MATHTAERQLREDLAAAFRLCHRFGWSESVGSHFSAAVSDCGRRFLLNPRWQHFATMRPADLLLLDADDPDVMARPDAPDPSAWMVHGTLRRMLPQARVVLHCHAPHALALSSPERRARRSWRSPDKLSPVLQGVRHHLAHDARECLFAQRIQRYPATLGHLSFALTCPKLEFQVEVGEGVADAAGQGTPVGEEGCMELGFRLGPPIFSPLGRGHLHHAAEQAALGPPAQE